MNDLFLFGIQNTVVAFLLCIPVWVITRVWKHPPAAHLLWLLILVKMVSPTIWKFEVPDWRSTSITGERVNRETMSPTPIPATTERELFAADLPARSPELADKRIPAPRGTDVPRNQTLSRFAFYRFENIWDVLPNVVLGVWFAGIVIVIVSTVRSAIRFQHLLNCMPLAPSRFFELAADLRQRMQLQSSSDIRTTDCSSAPLVWFFFRRPVILLPTRLLSEMDEVETSMILTHELAHLRRLDHWVRICEFVIAAIYWWHPLVWWVRRQLRDAEEQSCDAWVASMFPERRHAYAEVLFKAASQRVPQTDLALATPFFNSQSLKHRIRVILEDNARHSLSRRMLVLLVLLAVAVIPAGVRSQEARQKKADAKTPAVPTTDQPKTPAQKISAAELVQKIYDDAAWIDSASSLLIRTNRRQIWSTEERRSNAKGKAKPYQQKSELEDYLITDESAWDAKRIRSAREVRVLDGEGHAGDPASSQIDIWDGAMAAEIANSRHGRQYVLDNKPDHLLRYHAEHSMFNSWGTGDQHRPWWLPIDVAGLRRLHYLTPDDFEHVGREDVSGHSCYVVESRAALRRLAIGIDDGRLYRQTWSVPDYKKSGSRYLEMIQKIGGPKLKTDYHWQPWLDSLSPEERYRAEKDLAVAQAEFSRPMIIYKYEDYREVAPGRWFAFKRTIFHYDTQASEPFVSNRTVETIVDFRSNEPLADELFEIKLENGVPVATDWRYDPPIRYPYNSEQTEAERVALCEKGRLEQKKGREELESRRAVLKSRIGQKPPELPAEGWLNGAPMNWAELRGKVVVLHFWDVGCPPCQNELPILQHWNENSADGPIVVIGIHRQTDDKDAVLKKLKEFGLEYRILIDAELKESEGLGQLHHWFGNSWWPNTVLINKKGFVAAHGELFGGDIAQRMRELAAEPD